MKFSSIFLLGSLLAPFVAASPVTVVERSNSTSSVEKRQILGTVCASVNLCGNFAAAPPLCTTCTVCLQADILTCLSASVNLFNYGTCTCEVGAVTTTRRKRDDIYIDAAGQVAIGEKKNFLPNQICPGKATGCKVPDTSKAPGLTLFKGDKYECLDLDNDVESCGGCVSEGQGQDCTAIPHAEDISCQVGKCAVLSCEAGFTPSADGLSCEAGIARKKRGHVKYWG